MGCQQQNADQVDLDRSKIAPAKLAVEEIEKLTKVKDREMATRAIHLLQALPICPVDPGADDLFRSSVAPSAFST